MSNFFQKLSRKFDKNVDVQIIKNELEYIEILNEDSQLFAILILIKKMLKIRNKIEKIFIIIDDFLKKRKNFDLNIHTIKNLFEEIKTQISTIKIIRNQRKKICNTCSNKGNFDIAIKMLNDVFISTNLIKNMNQAGNVFAMKNDIEKALKKIMNFVAQKLFRDGKNKKNNFKQLMTQNGIKFKNSKFVENINILFNEILHQIDMYYDDFELLIEFVLNKNMSSIFSKHIFIFLRISNGQLIANDELIENQNVIIDKITFSSQNMLLLSNNIINIKSNDLLFILMFN